MEYGEDIFPNIGDYCTTFGVAANSSVGHCYFDKSQTLKCKPSGQNMVIDEFEMDNTITTEFGLFCDEEYKVALAGSSFMAGVLVGSFVCGALADRFGRRKTGLATVLLCGLSQLAGSFARTYYGFIVSQFTAAIGIQYKRIIQNIFIKMKFLLQI